MGLPPTSAGKESAYNAGDPGSIPESEDPLKQEMATPVFLLAGLCGSEDRKRQTRLSD